MGLYKRHKVWWMSFTYRGRQVRTSSRTTERRLAEAILGKVKTKIVEGHYFETLEEQDRTCEELMARYQAEHVGKIASQRCYRGCIRNLLKVLGPLTLSEVTPSRIVQYKATRYGEGVQAATINRELAVLKHVFNLAIREWEWCRENPVRRVSMEKEPTHRDRWLMEEEEARLLEVCPCWLRDLVTFALHTGMRMGEMLSLSWEGVDLFRKTVTVFRSKNGDRRTIPINQVVVDLLKAKSKVRALRSDRVFHSQTTTALDQSHLRRAFREALKKAGIANFRFHDLRHTFATRLVQEGVDLYKVQRLLGHRSPLMTQRYAHHYPESLRDGVDRLVSTKLSHSVHLAELTTR